MKIKNISFALILLMSVACASVSDRENNQTSVDNNCTSFVEERYGNLEGFKILNVKTYKATEVKLALGPHDDETESIVSVVFTTDSLKEKDCSCLMRADGSFIITADEIIYE